MNEGGEGSLVIAVSRCLLGEKVRYNGAHKRHAGVVEILSAQVSIVPVCPEWEAGLGVPRPPLVLHADAAGGLRLVMPASSRDVTGLMADYCRERLRTLVEVIDGAVVKARSPSCGLGDVAIGGKSAAWGDGYFVHALRQAAAQLPVVREDQLEGREGVARFLDAARAYRARKR